MTTPLLCFRVCEQAYALPIEAVVEVAAMVAAVTLEGQAHPALYGVVTRRGAPLLLIDLRELMGCDTAEVGLDTLFIVVRHPGGMAGFIVDEVDGVIYLNDDAMRPVAGGRYTRGVATHEEQVLQWLSVAPILADTLPDHNGER